MIRKVIIVGLTLGAAVLATTSLIARLGGGSVTWQHYKPGGTHLGFYVSRTHVRIFSRIPNVAAAGSAIHKFNLAGSEWYKEIDATGRIVWLDVCVPLWLTLTLLVLYPIFASICSPLRRHRRRKRGLCLTCGYNLAGNTSGVCPECGVLIDSDQRT